MKSIGESRSKQEEDKIIVGEIAILKQHLSAPNISAKKMKDSEMLGGKVLVFATFERLSLECISGRCWFESLAAASL